MAHQSLSQAVTNAVAQAIQLAVVDGELPTSVLDVPVDIKRPSQNVAGDYATTFCLQAAKTSGLSTSVIFEALLPYLEQTGFFTSAAFAQPGFINFELSPAAIDTYASYALHDNAPTMVEDPHTYNVEYVSVNPNGPITVAAARGAVIGDVLSRVLKTVGHDVTREYYVNDGVNSEQMRLFGKSVKHHAWTALEIPSSMPANGYQGAYVEAIAKAMVSKYGKDFLLEQDVAFFQSTAQAMMIAQQKSELAGFGVEFDVWSHEQELYESGKDIATLAKMKESGALVEKEGALWLNSSAFGDQENRVVLRSDGRPTYVAGDIAYHWDKYQRGHDRLIDLLGPDHHGYIPRLKAGVAAVGEDPDTLFVLIFQAVRFIKDGEAVLMRKRDGNLYTLSDLTEELAIELGSAQAAKDVVRFFYLYMSANKHVDFDLSLAVKQAAENPCFYAQYAHARCCSVLTKAGEPEPGAQWALLSTAQEKTLLFKCLELPAEITRVAEDYGVHRLAHYAVDTAKLYHAFYEHCKVILPDNPKLSNARKALVLLVKQTLASVLGILGVSAPETM
ncbi:MAG: arginine--tRNA ligase [Armatimonadetes bacterium]|nr:arginine--tRNA ligase [Armatimonadota bacterium]